MKIPMVKKKNLGIIALILALVIPVFIFIFLPEEPYSQAWIEDPSFDVLIDSPWNIEKDGDLTDINASIIAGQAKFEVLGDIKTYTGLTGTPNSSTSLGWKRVRNGNFLFPDTAIIDSRGCFVYHYLDENAAGGQVRNYPSVHWSNNISLPVEMKDYVITSAYIDVIFNATVNANVDTPNDNYTLPVGPDQFAIGDDVTFYVELSDLENSFSYRIGEFKSEYLGQSNPPLFPDILNITDRNLNFVSELDLIAALTSVLEVDNHNFIITLGIDIYCEDNDGSGDHDEWDELIIKSCDLNFTYEKKIDQFSKISFTQEAGKITGENILIVGGFMNFNYSIDQAWPSSAPLSEIRFYINDKLYEEGTILLTSASTSFQEAKNGGFDITSFLEKDVNTTVSIQLFLKDNFEFNQSIIVNIDDVSFIVEVIEVAEDMSWLVYTLIGSILILGVVITLYNKIFQYPKLVRKIRTLKKKIKKGKKLKPLFLSSHDDLINNQVQKKMTILEMQQNDEESSLK